MNTINSLVPFGGLTITTVSGETLTLSPASSGLGGGAAGTSVADYVGGTGGSKPLPSFKINQPKAEAPGQFVLVQSESAINEAGERERYKTSSAPLGRVVTGRIVGYTLNRSFMPPFDPAHPESGQPLCKSENFVTPVAAFDGKFSHECARFDTATNRLVEVCPKAVWYVDSKGKNTVDCRIQYVFCVAVEIGDETVYAEMYIKGKGAVSGRTLIQQLRALEINNLPLYTYPVQFTVTDAGTSYAAVCQMQVPPRGRENEATPDQASLDALETGVGRWQEALRVRVERAARLPEGTSGTVQTPAPANNAAQELVSTMHRTSSVPAVPPTAQPQAKPLI